MLLKQLEALVALYENGSFPEAAKSIEVPLATLRTRIRLLEREFGVEVVRRSGRGVGLTEVGWAILPYAQRIADIARRTNDILTRPSETPLSLGSVESACASLVAPALQLFAEHHADARVVLLRGDGARVQEMLMDGSVRLGLLAGEYDRLRFRSLWSHRAPVDAFASVGQSLREIRSANLPVAILTGEPVLEQAAARLNEAPLWRVDSLAVAKDLAVGGRAVAILPLHAARAELAAGSLQRLHLPALARLSVKVHCLAVHATAPTPEERDFLNRLARVV